MSTGNSTVGSYGELKTCTYSNLTIECSHRQQNNNRSEQTERVKNHCVRATCCHVIRQARTDAKTFEQATPPSHQMRAFLGQDSKLIR